MKKSRQPETELRDAIRDALLRSGVLAIVNAQVGRTHRGGLGTGSADLICCVRGRFVGIEVKMLGKPATADQLAWGELIRRHGGAYYVVTSVAEAIVAVGISGVGPRA